MINLLFLPMYRLLYVIMARLIDRTTDDHVGVRQDVLLFVFKNGKIHKTSPSKISNIKGVSTLQGTGFNVHIWVR